MRKRVLVLFSGGYDSTALLEKHLREGTEVIAFHIIMKQQRNNRWRHELTACRKIIKMLQEKYGEFRYFEETYDSSLYSWDSPVWAFITPNLLKHKMKKFRNVFVDDVQTEKVEVQVAWCVIDCRNIVDQTLMEEGYEFSFAGEIYKSSLLGYDNMPELVMPFRKLEKEKYRHYISDDIFKEIFRCRRPFPDGSRCEKCQACTHSVMN